MLKLQGDARLISLVRDGDPGAFDIIVDRYHSRLLGFCRQMLGCTEDAEDVLQEVYVNAFRAMVADQREINLRPWLYRIARNRCLNHLRKPVADAKESMDAVPVVDAASTHERVHNREEFRQLLSDVKKLPDTQRAALLLREMDALSYEEIAQAMETTVPSVKSLLVRARISLAEASQARLLTCGEVRLQLAEAAEGLCKASSPARRHVRECPDCSEFRTQIRSDSKVLAALSPIGPLLALKGLLASKLGLGGGAGTGATSAAGTAGAGAGGAGSIGAGAGALGAGAGALGSGAAAGGLGAVGAAIGAKAVAGVVTAAVITAGAVEVRNQVSRDSAAPSAASAPATADTPAPAVAAGEAPAAITRPDSAPVATEPAAPVAVEPPAETPVVVETGTAAATDTVAPGATILQAGSSVAEPLAQPATPGTDTSTDTDSPGGPPTGSGAGSDRPGDGGTTAGQSQTPPGAEATPGAESSSSGAGTSGSSSTQTSAPAEPGASADGGTTAPGS